MRQASGWFVPRSFLEAWHSLGWSGVDLFFVLSGFLVSGLLFREQIKRGSVRVGRFLIRRGFKIYPAFYCLLLATVIADLVGLATRGHRMSAMSPIGYLFEALFLQNYGPYIWLHTWSLAVEEHFYLSLALFTFLMVKRSKTGSDPFRLVPRLFAVVAPTILIIRILHYQTHPYYLYPHGGWRVDGALTHFRLDSLLFGVFLSYYYHYHAEATKAIVCRYKWIIALASILLVCPFFYFQVGSRETYTWGFTSLYLGYGGLLMLAMQWRIMSRWAQALLAPVGMIGYYSYSIYLWHWPVSFWVLRLLHFAGMDHLPKWVIFVVYLAMCIVPGIIMAKIIEVPFINLRNRLFPSVVENKSAVQECPVPRVTVNTN